VTPGAEAQRRYRERHPERVREQQRRYRARTRETYLADQRERSARRVAERGQLIRSLKEGRPCACCGGYFPSPVLEWHHRDPAGKDGHVLRRKFHVRLERLLAEVEKCDLLCANCHRLEHYEEEA